MMDKSQPSADEGVGEIMWLNVVESMSALVAYCLENDLPLPAEAIVFNQGKTGDSRSVLAAPIAALWEHESIKSALKMRSDFQLNTNTEYIMSRLDALAATDFTPSPEDVLQVRAMTTGAITVHLELKDCKVELVDLGGQRNYRKEWASKTKDVETVVFVAAVGDYDLKIMEDATTGRLAENLSAWKELCNSFLFAK
jgi:hypothetical protein